MWLAAWKRYQLPLVKSQDKKIFRQVLYVWILWQTNTIFTVTTKPITVSSHCRKHITPLEKFSIKELLGNFLSKLVNV